VIPKPTKDRLVPLSASARNQDVLPRYEAPLWSASTGLDTRNTIEMVALDAHIDWTTDFLDAAQNDIELPQHRKQSVIGIGCPKPIGIVTYEDILDALLQKTSLDEKDFFDRDQVMPPTKGRKEGDINSVSSNHSIIRTKKAVPVYVSKVHAAFERFERRSVETNNIIRRRNISGPDDGIDGTSEQSGQGFDGADERDVTSRTDAINDSSSYTENSLGGFHDPGSTVEFIHEFNLPSTEETVDSKMPTSSAFLPPVHLAVIDVDGGCPTRLRPNPSNSGYRATILLPRLRRVTPFSKQGSLSYRRTQAAEHCEPTSLVKQSIENIQDDGLLDEFDCENHLVKDSDGKLNYHHEGVAGVISACSWNEPDLFAVDSCTHSIDSPVPVLTVISNNLTTPDGPSQENFANASKIVSRNGIPADDVAILSTPENGGIRPREESFHDDRTLLPSQRKRRDRKSQSGGRRISLWF
jgi:metal transporter CNNM